MGLPSDQFSLQQPHKRKKAARRRPFASFNFAIAKSNLISFQLRSQLHQLLRRLHCRSCQLLRQQRWLQYLLRLQLRQLRCRSCQLLRRLRWLLHRQLRQQRWLLCLLLRQQRLLLHRLRLLLRQQRLLLRL
jgi:hypothetical protein